MAEWLVQLTSDHEVTGSNPARVGFQRMAVRYFIAQSLSLSPFSRLDVM